MKHCHVFFDNACNNRAHAHGIQVGLTVYVLTSVPCVQTKQALPTLARLIQLDDEEVLTDACWALSYLSDGANEKIQEVIQAGVCRRLVELLL